MAFAAGSALLLLGLVGLFLALLAIDAASQPPSPFTESGALCCDRPDTWAQSRETVGVATGVVFVDAALFTAGFGLLAYAGGGRSLGRRFALRLPIGIAAVAFAGLALTLVVRRGDAITPPDCRTFLLDRAVLRNDRGAHDAVLDTFRARHEAELQAFGVVHCRLVNGLTQGQVAQKLGTPTPFQVFHRRGHTQVAYANYNWVDVEFAHGRAADVRLADPDAGGD